jgi:putative membrane protein
MCVKEVRNMMYGWYNMMNYGGFGWILSFLFWLLTIFAVVAIVRSFGHRERDHEGPPHKDKPPLEILKERYAKGDINKEEYEEKKRDLA